MVTFDGKKGRKVKGALPSSENKYYAISTAIDYPSGPPHLGHLYEKVCTDAIARFKRLQNFKVHFSTGLDVHGLKIKRKADENGMKPEKFVEKMGKPFRELCKMLNTSYDDFIDTEEPRHYKVAQKLFKMLYDRGFIYKGEYKGPYCVDCETYYTEKDLENGRCPVHKKPVEMLSEESYFFKMEPFRRKLIQHIKENPDFIFPESRRNEILSRLKEPLRDLSVSRTSFKWGIPIPFDKKHIEFVWLEAVHNYLTTLEGIESDKFKKFWGGHHVIGKDIIFHHSVIFQISLLALGLPLSSQIIVHGFINLKGEKLSKARGIVIDPFELLKKYGSDPLRYFLLREIPFGEDGDFSEEALVTRNNDELADTLGNLVHRVLSFIYTKNKGVVPEPGKYDKLDKKIKLRIEVTTERAGTLMEELQLHRALEEILGLAKAGNEYFQAKEPWKGNYENCLYLGANLVRSLAILLSPFVPDSSERILKYLNIKPGDWESSRELFIRPGHRIRKPEPLFRKLELEEAQEERKKIKLMVDKGCKDLGIKVRGALIYGLRVKKKKGSLEKLKRGITGMRPHKDRIKGYLEIYRKLGLKGIGHPIERMFEILRNTGKLPTINTVVDSYNLVAVRESLSVGAHDLDRVGGDILFKICDGSETYVPLDNPNPKRIQRGEYAATDSRGRRVICRLDIKQCEGTKITPATRNVFLYVQGNSKTPDSLLEKALKGICQNIRKFCGGECLVLQ